MLQMASKLFKLTDVRKLLLVGMPGLMAYNNFDNEQPDEVPVYVPVNVPAVVPADVAGAVPVEDQQFQQVTITMRVPGHIIRLLRGFKGKKLIELQGTSRTYVSFPKGNGQGMRICKIMGRSDRCEHAKRLITKIVEEHTPVETENILINKLASGYVVGMKGKNIHFVRVSSDTVVSVNDPTDDEDPNKTVVTIAGTKRQVEAAKFLVMQVILRAERKLERSLMFNADEVDEEMAGINSAIAGFGSVSAFSGTKSVYIQKIGATKAKAELDKFMAMYKEIEPGCFKLRKGEVGILIAAECGEVWNRCRIAEVTEDENPENASMRLVCIDTGEIVHRYVSEVKRLLPRFFTIPQLSAQCALKNPRGVEWPFVSFETFESLVPIAKDYEIIVKIVGKETDTFGRPMPVIEIIDHQSLAETNIGEALEKVVYG